MRSKNKKKVAITFGLLIMALTLFRENLFLEINAILNGENINRANFYLFYDSLVSYSTNQLIQLKYIFTSLFIILFITSTFLTINFWFSSKSFNKITLAVLGGFVALLFLSFGIAKLVGSFYDVYFVFRKATGFLQSPLPLFILFSLFIYLNKEIRK